MCPKLGLRVAPWQVVSPVQEGGAYLMQFVSRGLSLQLVGGSMWTCPW